MHKGRELRQAGGPGQLNFVATAPVLDAKGNLIFGRSDGIVEAVTPDGSSLWRYSLPDRYALRDEEGLAPFAPGSFWDFNIAQSPAIDADGNVYVARNIAPNNGVYRVDRHGRAVRLPGTEQIVFPNALAFDHRGNLYVTETFSFDPPLVPYENGFAPEFGRGGIWKVPPRGTAELWLRDDLLTGLGPTLFPFPVGANGIAFYHGDLYVINTDQALVVRVPVCHNGQPGQPEVWKQVEDVPESIFYQNPFIPLMLDGLALDVHGNVYIAVPSRGAIVRINADDLSQETLAAYPGSPLLDAPLSLAFGTGKGERASLFISNGGLSEGIVPGLPWAGPGLLKIQVGIPVLPLP
jgi:sugar lactone lactonase YvrE